MPRPRSARRRAPRARRAPDPPTPDPPRVSNARRVRSPPASPWRCLTRARSRRTRRSVSAPGTVRNRPPRSHRPRNRPPPPPPLPRRNRPRTPGGGRRSVSGRTRCPPFLNETRSGERGARGWVTRAKNRDGSRRTSSSAMIGGPPAAADAFASRQPARTPRGSD